MKKIVSLVWIVVIGLFSSCSNDLNLSAEWKDIPIVYAFISNSTSVNYVRIEKAFLDPAKSAVEVAKIADSLYYDNILVQIERIEKGETITLQKVDGNEDGLKREDGTFATDPNTLYKFELADNNQLENGERIKLIINRGDTHPLVTAETSIVGTTMFTQGQPGDNIEFRYDRSIKFSWITGEHARLFNLKMYINIEESDPDNPGVFIPKTLEWIIATNIEPSSTSRTSHSIEGEQFYQFIQGQLDASLPIIRVFKDLTMEVGSGGVELLEFVRISQANTGITSSQDIPTYTNIDGGLGIFTSRNFSRKEAVGVTGITRDSLRDGIYTKALNFQ